MDTDGYVLSVSRYIHRNPVDAARPLVERLEPCPWSDYPACIGAATRQIGCAVESTVHALGGNDRPSACRAFFAAGGSKTGYRTITRISAQSPRSAPRHSPGRSFRMNAPDRALAPVAEPGPGSPRARALAASSRRRAPEPIQSRRSQRCADGRRSASLSEPASPRAREPASPPDRQRLRRPALQSGA